LITKLSAFDRLVVVPDCGSRDQYWANTSARDERRIDVTRDARVEVEAVPRRAVRAAREAAGFLLRRAHARWGPLQAAWNAMLVAME